MQTQQPPSEVSFHIQLDARMGVKEAVELAIAASSNLSFFERLQYARELCAKLQGAASRIPVSSWHERNRLEETAQRVWMALCLK
jgi:hypothetical protein